MILLQAAIAGGAVLLFLFGLFMLIGAPILTVLLMKIIRKILAKENLIQNKKPYFKNLLLYFLCLIFSIILLGLIFYLLLFLFDKFNPNFGYFN